MNREMLQKLFSEDKEIFQGGMLFPAWICKGKKEIENRNSPQRAAVFWIFPFHVPGFCIMKKKKACITVNSRHTMWLLYWKV